MSNRERGNRFMVKAFENTNIRIDLSQARKYDNNKCK